MYTEHKEIGLSKYDKLASILYQAIDVASCYNNDSFKNNLVNILEKLNNRKLRICILGSFASGKSSIINALLEESAFPISNHQTYYPCTIMYGAKREAILYFKDDFSSNEIECLPKVVKEYVLTNGISKIPALRITVDELEEFTTPNLLSHGYFCLPYSKIEIHIPNDFFKDKFEITRLPDFDNSLEHKKLLIEQVCADDIIIMVMNAQYLCTMDEMDFIEYQLKPRGITPIFVITHYDCIKETEKELIQKFAEMKLSSYSPYEILFVSTNQSLESLEVNNMELYYKSNIESFKVLLSSIIQQKNLTFLTHLAEDIRSKIHPYTLIKDSKNGTIDIDKTEKIYNINICKEELEHKRQFILDRIKLLNEYDIHKLGHLTKRYFYSISAQLPYWIDSYTPHHHLSIHTKTDIMRLAQELSSFTGKRIKDNIQKWASESLNAEVEQMFLVYRLNVEEFLLKLYKDLNDLYQHCTINTLTSYRIAQIKESLIINNELSPINIRCEMNDFSCVNIDLGCHIVPLSREQIINRIKKEVASSYYEYLVSDAIVDDIMSETRSRFEEFNHIVSMIIQEDIDYLDCCKSSHDNLGTCSDQYKNVLNKLDSYISYLSTLQNCKRSYNKFAIN